MNRSKSAQNQHQSDGKPGSGTTVPIIAITGSMGSGKSALAAELETLGAFIIDADVLAREVVAPGSAGQLAVQAEFGAQFILPDGNLNRTELGRLVFSSPEKLHRLESILHPLVAAQFRDRIAKILNSDQPPALIAYVVPLLFEKNLSLDLYTATVVVTASDQEKIRRVTARDKLSPEMINLRLSAQLPDSTKAQRADIVIENNGTLLELRQRALDLFSSFVPNTASEPNT